MITLTGYELYGIIQPLTIFCREYKLPIKASYRLSKILKRAQDEFNILDGQRIALVKIHGQAQSDGSFKIDETDQKNLKDFKEKMDEFLSKEIKIDLSPVDISLLENVDVKAFELLVLQKLFEGEI